MLEANFFGDHWLKKNRDISQYNYYMLHERKTWGSYLGELSLVIISKSLFHIVHYLL